MGILARLIGAFVLTASVAACGAYDEAGTADGGNGGDGGDGAVPAAAVPADGGLLGATPSAVGCFGQTCAPGLRCCYDAAVDGGSASCHSTCPAGAPSYDFRCDDRADCRDDKLCCFNVDSAIAGCDTSCIQDRLCRTDDECDSKLCIAIDCRGATIGACSPVGRAVGTFCSP